MSYGFLALNGNSQVLVSSDTQNLHFVGKYTYPTYIDIADTEYGGINVVRYRITCSATPLVFFTAPNTNDYYAISRVTSVSTDTWDVEVLKTNGADAYPEIYVFATPDAVSATETHGMIVYKDNGSASFDSRKRPLVITNSFDIVHPDPPRDFIPAGLDADGSTNASNYFIPNQVNSITISSSIPEKPMFFYSSLAQATMQRSEYRDRERGIPFLYTEYTQWWATYWASYRGVIKRSSSTQIDAGWAVVRHNVMTKYNYSRGGFLGWVGEIINVFDDYTSADGAPPYNQETLNTQSASFLISNASRYD